MLANKDNFTVEFNIFNSVTCFERLNFWHLEEYLNTYPSRTLVFRDQFLYILRKIWAWYKRAICDKSRQRQRIGRTRKYMRMHASFVKQMNFISLFFQRVVRVKYFSSAPSLSQTLGSQTNGRTFLLKHGSLITTEQEYEWWTNSQERGETRRTQNGAQWMESRKV